MAIFSFFNRHKKITELLYSQNLELAVKNKTLALLESLYQASVLTLMPDEMAKTISDIIRRDLNLELAGILIFNKDTDTLTPLYFSESERLATNLHKAGISLNNMMITGASKHSFFGKVINYKDDNLTNDAKDIWPNLDSRTIKEELHLKTVLLDPLVKGSELLGVLILGLNRNYESLSSFEKSSIRSFINVISLVLDKAYLYKNLQDSYEITKRALIVEKKAKEELEELDKVKNQFLTSTQHDLRTPLTTIIGYSSLIIEGTMGKQTKKMIDIITKIKEVAEKMKERANSFLDTAQFKLGKGFLMLKPDVDLKLILKEVADELSFKAKEKGIDLIFNSPSDDKKLNIIADREKLKGAIFNIVDNAIKYTPKGSVVISIDENYQMKGVDQNLTISSPLAQTMSTEKITATGTSSATKTNKPAILVIIKDTGIGIHADKLPTLFTVQGERSEEAKKVAEGKGVGLYFSGQIIQYHHGQVWAESEGDNKGSTFFVALSKN